ncbi:hypothetical protein [Actinomadura formosensis]|uniref:hypothetical protein n=1 Tax=Actinomadura formosensis TaxID=60706 RepID=UPI000A3DF29D|nr:hypothetical protein [Actinomadura formosensis]
MPETDNDTGWAMGFADPVLDPLRGTGPRPAVRPAPGCPLRVLTRDGEPKAGGAPGDAG